MRVIDSAKCEARGPGDFVRPLEDCARIGPRKYNTAESLHLLSLAVECV